MTRRTSLTKKQRFEVFKRDGFTCQYCGRRPPDVILEVDHIIAVAKGGGNEDHNLICACVECNQDKRDGTLNAAPIDVRARAETLRERMEQTEAYDALLREQKEKQDWEVYDIATVYADHFDGWDLNAAARTSIRRFLKRLPFTEVLEAMEMACGRTSRNRAFLYFCGICWSKIKGKGR